MTWCGAETVEWLQKHVTDYEHWSETCRAQLVMRKNGDFRPDTEVKLEMVQELGLTPETCCAFWTDLGSAW